MIQEKPQTSRAEVRATRFPSPSTRNRRYTAIAMLRFEWDPAKARTNERKHGVSFEDAIHVFDDPHALFELDRADESGELRWHAIGLIAEVMVVLVAHTVREEAEDEIVRLISARRATPQERKRYEETRAQDVS